MSIGDSLTFRVLHQGQPLAGAKLAAGYQGPTGHKYPVWLTTDAAGRATVKFDRAGAWYVRTLHMIPTVNDAESDWESAFSTVTFEVRGSMAPSEADAIRAVLTAQAEAWNRGDVEGYMQGHWKSDQLLFVGASGVVRGWQATLERYRTRYPGREAMGTLAFSDLEITSLASDAALVLGRWQLERTRDGKPDRPGGVFTLTLRKFPDGWRIIADHTSSFAN
jgi:ketosteroid isomerase-like protein